MSRFGLLVLNEFRLFRTAVPIHLVAILQPTLMYVLMSVILVSPTFDMQIARPLGNEGNALLAAMVEVGSPIGQPYINPMPESADFFGRAVAGVGTDKVLVGASGDNTGADDAGAAYLFSTDGTLLTTYTNPSPESSDFFGSAVSGVGSDMVLIGAHGDNTGVGSSGVAYLFSVSGTLLMLRDKP